MKAEMIQSDLCKAASVHQRRPRVRVISIVRVATWLSDISGASLTL